MIVDLNFAGKSVSLSIHEPRGLPLASPESVKVGVDAADVDLEVTVLVEAKASAGSVFLVVCFDILINSSLDASPNKGVNAVK